jgi:hypothetical protein
VEPEKEVRVVKRINKWKIWVSREGKLIVLKNRYQGLSVDDIWASLVLSLSSQELAFLGMLFNIPNTNKYQFKKNKCNMIRVPLGLELEINNRSKISGYRPYSILSFSIYTV